MREPAARTRPRRMFSALDDPRAATAFVGVVAAAAVRLTYVVLRVGNDQPVGFLAAGHIDAPAGPGGVVETETHFDGTAPAPCAGELRTLRVLSVCLPPGAT